MIQWNYLLSILYQNISLIIRGCPLKMFASHSSSIESALKTTHFVLKSNKMKSKIKSISKARQDGLYPLYQQSPELATITDRAITRGGVNKGPFHGNVQAGDPTKDPIIPFGIHKAVGGFSDMPNPGDILCAAIASCLDSTIRIIADRLNVPLTFLEVEVKAEVDVRGTLLISRETPVGFQKIKCYVNMEAAKGTDPEMLNNLLVFAEHSCVNIQTLKNGVEIETQLNQ